MTTMKRPGFFFERCSEPGRTAAFYIYKGYCYREKKDTAKHDPSRNTFTYPIRIHFSRDELVFTYQDHIGRSYKIFSLYAAEGELNQAILSKTIQNYWKMPLWSPPIDAESSENNQFIVGGIQFEESYFSRFHGISLFSIDKKNSFVQSLLFKQRQQDTQNLRVSNNHLEFRYNPNQDRRSNSESNTLDLWEIDNDGATITTNKINFQKLLLDFLFELEYASTFEDENFFRFQPVLQNNKLLDALSRKCRYLDNLAKLKNFKRTNQKSNLPKPFLDAEASWLNVCYQETYLDVFITADSLFDTVENEVASVFFHSHIGQSRKPRKNFFTKNEARLRNQAATFFLRRYALFNAIKALMPVPFFLGGLLIIILISMGDFALAKFFPAPEKNFVGIFGFGLPILCLLFLVSYYAKTHINLFKLIMPRMFLGILIGWAAFWGSEESWKSAVMANAGKTTLVNAVLCTILVLYIFTDIRNKLIRTKNRVVLKRAIGILALAMLISFMQGFYVLQLKAKPILENSGFLTTDNLNIPVKMPFGSSIDSNKIPHSSPVVKHHIFPSGSSGSSETKTLKEITVQEKYPSDTGKIEILRKQTDRNFFDLPNYDSTTTLFGFPLYYIWSVHFSQFMMAILAGIVLQLLWEDRPITEPL